MHPEEPQGCLTAVKRNRPRWAQGRRPHFPLTGSAHTISRTHTDTRTHGQTLGQVGGHSDAGKVAANTSLGRRISRRRSGKTSAAETAQIKHSRGGTASEILIKGNRIQLTETFPSDEKKKLPLKMKTKTKKIKNHRTILKPNMFLDPAAEKSLGIRFPRMQLEAAAGRDATRTACGSEHRRANWGPPFEIMRPV